MAFKKTLTTSIAAIGLGASALAMAQVDDNLPTYDRVSGVSGNLTSVGSDTLNNLMTLWSEAFAGFYPNVNVQVQGAGSSTAPPALVEGTANFGPMSRPMRDSEIRAFEERHGHAPTEVPVAIDMVAVYVNLDNPIEGLSIPEVDAIFSATRACGYDSNIATWGEVGMTGGWGSREITLYGRNSVSGTYGYFRENALCGGDFKDAVNEQPGSSAVVRGVEQTLGGIGYSGIGYRTSGVRAIPLGPEVGGPTFEPNADNAATGDFPLARFLYVYANESPSDGWNPLEREFFRMVLAKEGQEVVDRDGYVPLSNAASQRFMDQLNLN